MSQANESSDSPFAYISPQQERRLIQEHLRLMFIRETDLFVQIMIKRVIGSFAKVSEEAIMAGREEGKRLRSLASTHRLDESSIRSISETVAAAYSLNVGAVAQGTNNLVFAGLFHQFEQHVCCLLAVSYPKWKPPRKVKEPLDHLKQVLKAGGVSPESFQSWTDIQELRLIANTVKHGVGPSSRDLEEKRPELFSEAFRESKSVHALRPLSGIGLNLTESDLRNFGSALSGFWKELRKHLRMLNSTIGGME